MNNEPAPYIPTRLYRLRERARFRQADLAKRAETSTKVIGHAEGRKHTVGPELQARIATVFAVPPEELFDEAGLAIPEKPLPRWQPTPLEKEAVRLTREGRTRQQIVRRLDLESVYEVWRIQRDAGLLPLPRGRGGKP